MFDGFTLEHLDLGEVSLRVRHGGPGEPVVLLHGHPRTHTTWHAVAPRLATTHAVVCPDLRGYGRSTLPPDAPDHAQSSKRAMARDVVGLMARLGHERFAVVGHDRGALVAFRTAMDHPVGCRTSWSWTDCRVVEHLERTDATFAQAWWHWWFLGQTDKPAERVINADPDAWYRTPPPEAIGAGEPRRHLGGAARSGRRPRHVRGLPRRAGNRPSARRGRPRRRTEDRLPDLVARIGTRRPRHPRRPDRDLGALARQPLRHRVIDSGHHQAEEAPDEVADALLEFLATA